MTFTSRKAAKIACRRRFPNEKLNGYPCPVVENGWHAGHLAPAVRAGAVSRGDWYKDRGKTTTKGIA
ncbi:hypothetical protein ACFRAQ_35910 [Nocardia sp. NPDC056611]|uniref:hypothetical protein n=1 Tax=Nocardia sp. NPDC056611 TaxID=3345877 RepID=UPI00366BAB30